MCSSAQPQSATTFLKIYLHVGLTVDTIVLINVFQLTSEFYFRVIYSVAPPLTTKATYQYLSYE